MSFYFIRVYDKKVHESFKIIFYAFHEKFRANVKQGANSAAGPLFTQCATTSDIF